MKNKMTIILIFFFSMAVGIMSVYAAGEKLTKVNGSGTMKVPRTRTDRTNTETSQGMYKLNGKIVYCADISKKLKSKDTFALQSNSTGGLTSEEVIKLGLYQLYLDTQTNLTAAQKFYKYMQGEVWKLTNKGLVTSAGTQDKTYEKMVKFYNDNKSKYECEAQYYKPTGDKKSQPVISFTCKEMIKAECVEDSSLPYGTCNIKITDKGQTQTQSVSCNTYSKQGSKYNYNGTLLELRKTCPYKPMYDYGIDVACENCDSNNENGSYFIQDTTDWKAILNSPKVTNKIKKYYTKSINDCDVYCREEYRVILPNDNDKITTEAGRYFTVNKLGTILYANGIPNYKQIKVEKIRECRSTSKEQQKCLTNFANSAKSRTGNAAGSTGTIKLKYKENYKNSKYNKTITLEENQNRTLTKQELINTIVGNSTTMLRSTVTKYYELPEDTYRWVNYRDGLSSLNKPSNDVIDHFLDMETSNLPISNENYSSSTKSEKGAEITFNYSLPTQSDDPYTLIAKAFNTENNYFLDPKSSDNIYKKQKNNKLNEEEKTQIKESACAKLYGYGTRKFNTCVSERTTNKVGKCYTQITGENKYICDIDVCPKGEMLVQKCENGKTKLVCSKEQTLNEECPGDKTCKVENGKYYGQQGIEVSKEKYLKECPCKKENNKYYIGEVEVLKADYEKVCPSDNDNSCKLCNGGKCCEDLDMVCPDEMGECPARGNTIIYRTIDLKNPFPGQTNYQRQTGSNWCSYNSKTSKINCKNTNNVATAHIQNNRKNKDESVYKLEPLYEVDLNATNMKAIRDYND
ncbi:MAG: hypothetical protein HFH47_01480, partial [Bacilli bacterium]|nr:hypothetical protein [Bacilli bacterium]